MMNMKQILEKPERMIRYHKKQAAGRRQEPNSQRLSGHFLEILDHHQGNEVPLEVVLSGIIKLSGCEAVDIRTLNEESNIP